MIIWKGRRAEEFRHERWKADLELLGHLMVKSARRRGWFPNDEQQEARHSKTSGNEST